MNDRCINCGAAVRVFRPVPGVVHWVHAADGRKSCPSGSPGGRQTNAYPKSKALVRNTR